MGGETQGGKGRNTGYGGIGGMNVQLHERGCHAAQLAVISQDLWFSQMKSTHLVDYVALDLDPMPSVPFEQVVQVALQCRDVVETSSRH